MFLFVSSYSRPTLMRECFKRRNSASSLFCWNISNQESSEVTISYMKQSKEFQLQQRWQPVLKISPTTIQDKFKVLTFQFHVC